MDALAGAPGVRSARFAAEDVPAGAPRAETDRANNRKLLAAMEGVPPERRTARFVCRLALADGERIVLEAEGAFEGQIGTAPRGDNGFGYDPVFLPAGLDRSAAELSATEKNAFSHRGQAARQFARQLKELLDGAAEDAKHRK